MAAKTATAMTAIKMMAKVPIGLPFSLLPFFATEVPQDGQKIESSANSFPHLEQ